jgi:phospholipid transport system substrate-binding protein
MKKLPALLTLLISLLLCMPALAGAPSDFVKKKSERLFDVVNQPIGPARTKALKAEVRTLVSYEELAKRSLGKHWAERSDAEKKEFVDILERLVEFNYADRFKSRSSSKSYKVAYTDEKVREGTGQAIVKTTVTYGDEVFTLDYKLIIKDGNSTIYDAVFDDISLEETYRESYVPIIEKEGWGSLIKRMKDKLAELEKG